MTLTLSILIAALLFAGFGVLRAPDRCDRNCGGCPSGCRSKEHHHV